jgi:hypothetical protein
MDDLQEKLKSFTAKLWRKDKQIGETIELFCCLVGFIWRQGSILSYAPNTEYAVLG